MDHDGNRLAAEGPVPTMNLGRGWNRLTLTINYCPVAVRPKDRPPKAETVSFTPGLPRSQTSGAAG